MSVVFGLVQVLLALAFLMAGFMKLTPADCDVEQAYGVDRGGFARVCALHWPRELLGGIGLILAHGPGITCILPGLTVAAAIGLSHRDGERGDIPPDAA